VSGEPRLLPGGDVHFDLSSTIPGTIEVTVSPDLAGREDDYIWSGSSEHARITDGRGPATLRTPGAARRNDEARVTLYPRWGLLDEQARASGVRRELTSVTPIRIRESGEAAASVVRRREGQHWVMETVTSGDR
jgi:hypothetical protein